MASSEQIYNFHSKYPKPFYQRKIKNQCWCFSWYLSRF